MVAAAPNRPRLSSSQSLEVPELDTEYQSSEQGSSSEDDEIRYDPSDEARPDHRFFSLGFQNLFADGKDLASSIKHTLEDYAYLESSHVARLQEEAGRISRAGAGARRSVAILGDSGTGKLANLFATLAKQWPGKSSLINSLLNCPGLAIAVSCFVTFTLISELILRLDPEKQSPRWLPNLG